jgi:hypothetical protein
VCLGAVVVPDDETVLVYGGRTVGRTGLGVGAVLLYWHN